MADPSPVPNQRYISREGRSNLVKVGLRRTWFGDLYASWLTSTWRRVFALLVALVRASSAVFALSWLAVHPIDEKSMLFGQTAGSLKGSGVELYVSLTGLDETFNQTIHARRSYTADEILWGRRFVDIVGPLPDGRVAIDYNKFHGTKPA